jgi:4-amino-4-deoxy-L-arabinose transferase-like glycosyltransferase
VLESREGAGGGMSGLGKRRRGHWERIGSLARRRPGLCMGLLAGLAVGLTLADPGLTVDEPLDVRPGRTYVATLRAEGWRFFDRAVVDRVFRDNAEHPPLGRWLLGVASTMGQPFQVVGRGVDPTGLYVLSGRLSPAAAFAVLVGLVASEAGRRWGSAAGLTAGWSLLVMPRVFAHAHFAALDTFLALFWTLALIGGARVIESSRPVWGLLGAGVLWSLALLTKIHAWLLAPLMATWALVRLGWKQAVGGMVLWMSAGVGLFYVGWPWLWYETIPRWAAYWGTSLERASIVVEYLGRFYPDRDLPWHYPWVYFAVTVPVGLHALGLFGLRLAWRLKDSFIALLAGSMALFLGLFSTGVPVYDGERLFLHIFPAWAMVIGLGTGGLWNRISLRPRARTALAVALAAQSLGLATTHPFGLSYYNLLTLGLPGAERLGLELTYWGDAVDDVLLDRLAREARRGATAALAPTLYPGQGILTTTRRLVQREIVLQDEAAAAEAEWVIVSRRRAYWRPELVDRLESGSGTLVSTRSRQGIWLSALWHFPASGPASPSRAQTSIPVPAAELTAVASGTAPPSPALPPANWSNRAAMGISELSPSRCLDDL